MVLRLLTLPFRVVGTLFSLVFTVAIVEGLGLTGYLQWRHPEAFESLLAGGVGIGEVLSFLSGRPDALGVAVVLFVIAVVLVVSDSGSSGHADGWDGHDGHDGGGFGGFGGDGGGGGFGGGDGGGGGGGDGGGGGE